MKELFTNKNDGGGWALPTATDSCQSPDKIVEKPKNSPFGWALPTSADSCQTEEKPKKDKAA